MLAAAGRCAELLGHSLPLRQSRSRWNEVDGVPCSAMARSLEWGLARSQQQLREAQQGSSSCRAAPVAEPAGQPAPAEFEAAVAGGQIASASPWKGEVKG